MNLKNIMDTSFCDKIMLFIFKIMNDNILDRIGTYNFISIN